MRRALLLSTVFVSALACTQDYDQFSFGDDAAGTGAAVSGPTTTTGAGAAGSSASSTGAANGGGGSGAGTVDCAPCRIENGSPLCVGDQCTIGSCDPGHDDCNDAVGDGCETPTDADVANCGACDRACDSTSVASAVCAGGLCTSTCASGHANCNKPATGPDDGCELDVTADSDNCGGCDNACSGQGYAGGLVCQGMACKCTSDAACKAPGNGTATCDMLTGHCACNGTACQQGEACVKQGNKQICACNGGGSCSAGQTCCQTPGGCKNLQTDAANCGGCGHACAMGKTCVAGACV